MYRLNQK